MYRVAGCGAVSVVRLDAGISRHRRRSRADGGAVKRDPDGTRTDRRSPAAVVQQFLKTLNVIDRVPQYLDFRHALVRVRTRPLLERLERLVDLP